MKLDVEQVRKLYWDENKTIREVATIFNTYHPTISEFMVKNNIPRRSRHDKTYYTKTRYNKKGGEMPLLNEQPMDIIEESLLNIVPTTTRGKTIELLEKKREAKDEFPIKAINEYIQIMNKEMDSIESEYTHIINKMQSLESDNKNSIIPAARRQINKSKMVTLELEKQDVIERRLKQVRLLDDLKYGSILIENIATVHNTTQVIEEEIQMIHEVEKSLKNAIMGLEQKQKDLTAQILKHYGLNKE